ncbi:MAG: hypothetical protein DRN12_03795 [Thermoplasmata archaeon]|nr:MAG: hypothetical protein DRN12_03795 [Thermoplasmata archaeon]
MPRPDRVRLRRIKRFERLNTITAQRQVQIRKSISAKDAKAVSMLKALRFRLKELHDTIAKDVIYVRSVERRKALLEIAYFANAVRYDAERLIAMYEQNMLQNYGIDALEKHFKQLIESAKAGMSGIVKPVDSLTHELARHYYAPMHPTVHHFTANMLRLTDLTMQFLKDMKAEFYTGYKVDLKDLASPFTRVANVLLQLAEFLELLMRKKGRREKVRKKARGHYGIVHYDEPVHTIVDVNLIPVDELPLNTILGNTYEFARHKAMSLGKPELATKFMALGVYIIPERKVFKKESFERDALLSYTFRVRKHTYW